MRPKGLCVFGRIDWFQSTHPCGVRPKWAGIVNAILGFNPRTPAGCDCRPWRCQGRAPEFQSTHPCGVRRPATRTGCAPSGGDLPVELENPIIIRRVLATHPFGVRLDFEDGFVDADFVSIHAPLRGASCRIHLITTIYQSFNPRTPAGCDAFC